MHGSRAFGGPVQASLRLTNRCNTRCVHCYYNSPYLEMPAFPLLRKAKMTGQQLPSKEDMKKTLAIDADTHHMKKIIRELLELGTWGWQLGGSGEMFLHKDAMEFVSILKHAGCHCLANTNGTLISKEMAEEFVRMQFDELRITTMAGSPADYVRTHPGTSFETFHKLKGVMHFLTERKRALKVKLPEITLILIVIAQNYNGLKDFAEFAAHVGADRVFFRPVDDIGDSGLMKTVPSAEQAAAVLEQLNEIRPFLESRGIDHNIIFFRKVFREKLNTRALYNHIPCYYGWLSSYVDPDGEVYPCCRCYDSLGNAYEKGFKRIWHGMAYQEFRNKAAQINKSKKPVSGCDCYSCVHHTANLKAYQALHPFKKLFRDFNYLS